MESPVELLPYSLLITFFPNWPKERIIDFQSYIFNPIVRFALPISKYLSIGVQIAESVLSQYSVDNYITLQMQRS